MFLVELKPGVSLGKTDLSGCWGTGQIWGTDWIGIVYVERPFDPSTMTPTNYDAGDTTGGAVSIQVAASVPVELARGPNCFGGHLHADGKTVSLWYRCVLKAGQYATA